MVGLACALAASHTSIFLTFAEGGRCEPLLAEVAKLGFEGVRLAGNYPAVAGAIKEIAGHLKRVRAGVVCCHGYKADLLGLAASRLVGIPAISISHGWTSATWKVRLNEMADRFCLRWMEHVVAVSGAQAGKIYLAGIASDRVTVIHNAVDGSRFTTPTKEGRHRLQAFFQSPRREILLAIGRLSPEKGFADLIQAASILKRSHPLLGLLIVGDGPERERLARQISMSGLKENVVLAGFRDDVEQILPNADLLAISSHTEGLPTVVLEAFSANVPVVATRVGGIPEIVEHGISGYLVPPSDPPAMAARVSQMLDHPEVRKQMSDRAREVVSQHFTFESQACAYRQLFDKLKLRQVAS
jgi:glycosyltransferase involved in cell wall biosynthesis